MSRPADVRESSAPLKVGIISAAWGAHAHLPAWRAIQDVEVVAICTSRRETAESAARQHGLPLAFWDFREMARDPNIDVIDCGTRPDYRRDMVLTALEHGKHVYNGIPFADSFDSARQIRDRWQTSGLAGSVDAFLEWIPAHRLMKEMIQGGFLGEPFACNLQFHISLFNNPSRDFPYLWFQHKQHGCSASRNLGSHALHLLLYLFGSVRCVVSAEEMFLKTWQLDDGSTIEPQCADTASLLMRFENGMIVTMQPAWNVAAGGSGWTLEAFGSRGRLRAEAAAPFPTHASTTLWAGGRDATGLERVTIPERLMSAPIASGSDTLEPPAALSMSFAFDNLKNSIRRGVPSSPDFEQAWQVERVLEAARRSQLDRAWVDLANVK